MIKVRGLVTRFGEQVVHDGLDLDVRRGEVLGVVGGSGSGKSVLLRTIVGLNHPAAGSIEVLGQNTKGLSDAEWRKLESRWGVLFQSGALFSSLTLADNVIVPLKEHTHLSAHMRAELAALKIAMTGLPPDSGAKFPAQLSGGMKKRAGLARALALDPELLFLDEPTAGLDPISAAAFDELIRGLQQSLGLTVFMVTHDLDSLTAICDRVAVLVDKKIKVDTMENLLGDPHPWIQEYFHGPRGRAARHAEDDRSRRAEWRPGPAISPSAPSSWCCFSGPLDFIVWVEPLLRAGDRIPFLHPLLRLGRGAGREQQCAVRRHSRRPCHLGRGRSAGFLPRPGRHPGQGRYADPHRFRGHPGDAGHHRRGAGGDQPRHQDRPTVEDRTPRFPRPIRRSSAC